jgi:3-mercaptopyruvate sulfurtransferase SseA
MSIVSTDWTEKNLGKIKIIDCSWHMPNQERNGHEEYLKNHIENAIFFDLVKIQTYHICLQVKRIGKKLSLKWV